MKLKNLTSILYFISGGLFFIAALIGKNYVYVPIGCCFIIQGITNSNKKTIAVSDRSYKIMRIT